jgi:hypothetical protein
MGTAYPRIDIYWEWFIIGHATLQEANLAIPVDGFSLFIEDQYENPYLCWCNP